MSIEIEKFNQYYGKKQILHSIDLKIEKGMYGLLGRNGAGKSTLMKTLATLLPCKEGEIVMEGIPVQHQKEIRSIIGYLPQDFSMYGNMSVYDVLDYLGILSDMKTTVRKERIKLVLEQVNLTVHKKTKVKAMSGGMRRRLGIAQALLHDPKILIVDEPTAGLDPEERLRFRNLLAEIADQRIVLLSTHIAGDIEAVAENLAILDQGKIIYSGTVAQLLHLAEGHVFTVRIPRTELAAVKEQVQVIALYQEGSHIDVRFIGKKMRKIMEHPLLLEAAPTLEDAYLYILQQKAGVDR
ncbi:ABC transporter ATP-binding protein [Enterococcus sp. BWM-S5]|uniref:ABC transporter ATP-binding protein n=1 Tax=Enterococcus larvae TaxID=2794352 RepID=A0ABS4CHG0_9ENTE|nr:ABC transporter ATP-binding protein [Enterococcus larvae]MBP1045996.1 ABC transporter ATP-binding protein [Enterococcus larvae]